MKKFYYISGLPRSGSTLLTAILKQNPKFHSEITDNLMSYILGVIETNHNRSPRSQISEQIIKNVVDGIFCGFYKHIDKEIIFNCNRGWTRYVEYLHRINPNFKIICCVRDIPWILNSYEKIYKTRTLREPVATNVYNAGNDSSFKSVWHRTDFLMNEGVVKASLANLKEAYFGPYRKHLFLVEYESIIQQPTQTIRKIYDFIDEEYYEHDFKNLEYRNEIFDDVSMTPNMHYVKKELNTFHSDKIIPPDLWQKYSNQEFWK